MDFIHSKIDPKKIIGHINYSSSLKKHEQGDVNGFSEYIKENSELFNTIITITKEHSRDTKRYYDLILQTWQKECLSWYNSKYNADLHTIVDPNFNHAERYGTV